MLTQGETSFTTAAITDSSENSQSLLNPSVFKNVKKLLNDYRWLSILDIDCRLGVVEKNSCATHCSAAVFQSDVPPWFHPLATFNCPPPTATDLLGLKVNHVILGKCRKCLMFPMWLAAGCLCSLALAHMHAFGNRKAEEVVGGQPSFLVRPLTPAALLPTMYEVVSGGGLILGSTPAAWKMEDMTRLRYLWTFAFAREVIF